MHEGNVAVQSNEVAFLQSNVTPRILDFIRRSAHSDEALRSDEKLSLDSAEWYVEAGLNLGLTQVWVQCDSKLMDSVEVWLPMVDGKILVNEALAAFVNLSTLLSPQNVENVKHLVVVDVKGNVVGNAVRYAVKYVVGSGYQNAALNTNYGPNDHWFYRSSLSDLCNCAGLPDGPVGTRCADKVIQDRIDRSIMFGIHPDAYLIDVETWYLLPNRGGNYTQTPSDFVNTNNNSGNSNQDYWTFMCIDSVCDNCMDPSDMTYHT